jgi:hypothetical protein
VQQTGPLHCRHHLSHAALRVARSSSSCDSSSSDSSVYVVAPEVQQSEVVFTVVSSNSILANVALVLVTVLLHLLYEG